MNRTPFLIFTISIFLAGCGTTTGLNQKRSRNELNEAKSGINTAQAKNEPGAVQTELGRLTPLEKPKEVPRNPSNPGNDTEKSAFLAKSREKAFSDDAISSAEALAHGMARAVVIEKLERNTLGVGGTEFRVKRNPVGRGCFVYDPRTRFLGVERKFVWWVVDGVPYALNSPSKTITPSLKWPRDNNLMQPTTSEIVGYVFAGEPIPTHPPEKEATAADVFTVNEYRIYRAVIDTPFSVSDTQTDINVAKRFGITEAKVKETCRKIQTIFLRNGWYSSREGEIKRASDWNGELR